MSQSIRRYLICSGIIALLAGVLHLAIIFGGPDWYAFFHAPARIVRLATVGALYPKIFCLAAAVLLMLCAGYAFSGAGLIRRLPFLHPALVLIGSVFILRGIAFFPLLLWRPDLLARVCDCRGLDPFLVVSSVICLATGIGYVLGARKT
ncbi:MAG: hypothetical protein QOH88_1579 [Verrucomicrobiota bacterium]|jgi:hypothetical protein